MNNFDLYSAINDIDKDIIEEAGTAHNHKKKNYFWGAIAAVFALIIAVSAFNLFPNKPIITTPNTTPTLETNVQTTTEQSVDNTLSTNAQTESKKDTEVTVPPTVSDKGNSEEIFLDSKYVTYITTGQYASYQEGKVIEESKVSEKIGDITVTAGWTNGSSDTITKPETLRAEIYAIKNISPDIAICIKFIDKGEALTTEHYYLRSNPNADRSEVEDYLIPEDILPIGADGSVPE